MTLMIMALAIVISQVLQSAIMLRIWRLLERNPPSQHLQDDRGISLPSESTSILQDHKNHKKKVACAGTAEDIKGFFSAHQPALPSLYQSPTSSLDSRPVSTPSAPSRLPSSSKIEGMVNEDHMNESLPHHSQGNLPISADDDRGQEIPIPDHPEIGTEADYYEGPAQVTTYYGGTRGPAVLMLKLDLSQRIVDAIQCKRIYLKEKAWAKRQRHEIEKFERRIRDKIDEKAVWIAGAKHQQMAPNSEAVEQLESWRNDVKIMKSVVEDLQIDKQEVDMKERYNSDDFVHFAGHVISYLEKIFVECAMTGPGDNVAKPNATYDFEEEYQRKAEELAEELNPPSPLHLLAPEMDDAMIKAQSERFAIYDTHQDAIKVYQLTQDNLEAAKEQRQNEWQELSQAKHNDQWSAVSEKAFNEFEKSWEPIIRRAEKRMTDSEEALKEAEGAALVAGVIRDVD